VLRVGVFLRQLYEWAEKPCVLTVRTVATASELRVTGVLRSYYSMASMHGWALVPPKQHGGWSAQRMTPLDAIADAAHRELVLTGRGRMLRFTCRELIFELERDDTILTPPPRVVRNGRYLYVGGRRRRIAEAWMLQ